MMRAALFLLLCLASPLAAEQSTGLATLDRRDSLLGWEAVGRIDIGEGGFCTGTLIATDLVLTAAHCVYQGGQMVDPGTIRFSAGKRGDKAVAVSQVKQAVAHPGYDPKTQITAEQIRHDLALLQLANPIPAAVAAPFVVQPPGRLKTVSVVSYARDRAENLSWQRACNVVAQAKGLMAFDCDVYFGSSGAPVFDRSGARARIVSIISSGRRNGAGTRSFGMELPEMLSDLKAELRAGRGHKSQSPVKTALVPLRRIGLGETSGTGAKFLRAGVP